MRRFGERDYRNGEIGKIGNQRRMGSDVGQQHGSKGRKRGGSVLENNKHPAEWLLQLPTHGSVRYKPDKEFLVHDVSGHNRIIRKVDQSGKSIMGNRLTNTC